MAKTKAAPGDQALNSSHRSPFNRGAAIKSVDYRKRREPRGGYPNGGPTATDLRRRGTVHTAFDAGKSSHRATAPRIPWSRIQRP